MEKLCSNSYKIGPLSTKPRVIKDLPETLTKYRKITSLNPNCNPLAFIIMLGYIQNLLFDNKSDGYLRFMDTIKNVPHANFIKGFINSDVSVTLMKWLEEIPRKIITGDLESWLISVNLQKEIQNDLENLLIKQCNLENKKISIENLPLISNILECKILFHCPFKYQKLLICPENCPALASEDILTITMENPNIYKLYISDKNQEKIIEPAYLVDKQNLKEKIISLLITERENSYAIFEKLYKRELIDPKIIDENIEKINELTNLIDKFVELKAKNAKKRPKNKGPQILLEYLKNAKLENEEIIKKYKEIYPIMQEIYENINQETLHKKDSNLVKKREKPPCMECLKLKENTQELKCNHFICIECLLSKINDLVLLKKTPFSIKCLIKHCYYTLNSSEIQALIGKDEYEKILGNIKFCDKIDISECMLCDKKSDLNLHENHAICKECLKKYIMYQTEGNIQNFNGLLNCPILNCTKQISCYKELFNFSENIIPKLQINNEKNPTELLDLQKNENLQKEEIPANIAKCYKCNITKPLCKACEKCNLFFCKDHCADLAREMEKNNCIFVK